MPLNKIKSELKKSGWLLESDSKLPSVVTLIVGEPVKGSWWGHEKGNLIFNTCSELADDKDVLLLKLVRGKRTYLHRRLWPVLFSLLDNHRHRAEAELSKGAAKLLRYVETKGIVCASQPPRGIPAARYRDLLRELEESFLCAASSEHSDAGHHELVLRSWKEFLKTRAYSNKPLPRSVLEKEISGTDPVVFRALLS